jgi:asparagine synthase (glutamine-hydrolysing)
MCGIAGILHFDTDRPVDPTLLRRMTDVLAHRGPDGNGYHIEANLGLGHRRLAIIDLSTGDQPMFSKDRNLVVVFNGEIYNYLELREELKALGHNFKTTSDTEVILSAYEEWGFDCQNKFNGMWSFALWDKRQNHLFLSRDRLGEKPLCFALRDNSFLFGSEIKSILASGFTYEPATHLLHVYLSFGWVPAPHTFFKGISKLMPGHFLVVKNGTVKEHTYWDLPAIPEKEMRKDAARIFEEFESHFTDSVKIRMRSDVPYGAFLSGGLDSSSVVAVMSEQSRSPIETFTIGFAEKAFDERDLARHVTEAFRTHHHEQVAQPESFDEALKKIDHHFDEPFGDASAMPVGMVSRLARQKVTMALTGDGGDEVLSGYTSYLAERFAERYRAVPALIRKVFYHSANGLSHLTRAGIRYRLNRLKRSLHLCGAEFEERFISKLALVDRNSIRRLIPADCPQLSIEDYLSDVFAKCSFRDPFYRLMYFHLKVSLPDDMLTKVDRMSMAYSLETRVPFLDHRLVELGWSVDKNVKMPRYNSKNILKQTCGRRLPPALLKAPKKPFSVPLREWFKQTDFEDKLEDLQRTDFGLNNAVIREIVNANRRSKEDYGNFIWRLFVLKNCILKTRAPAAPRSAVAAGQM